MSRPDRKRLVVLAKIVLAGALLAWLFSGAHWHDYRAADETGRLVEHKGLRTTLKQAHPGWMAGAIVLWTASLAAAGVRWRQLLAAQNVEVGLAAALKLTVLGEFVSLVVPGTVGGDAVKAYSVMKTTPGKSAVLVATAADRLIGLCCLVCLALVMLIVTLALGSISGQALTVAGVSIALAAGAVGAALALLLSPSLRRVSGLRRLLSHPRLRKYVAGASHAVNVLRRPRVLAKGAAVSVLSQGLQICAVLAIGSALGLAVEWYRYFLYVPIIFIVAAVPLTPGGLGVAEQLYVAYLAQAGGAGGVLALAILARLVWIVCILPGAAVLVLGPRLPPAETIRTELAAAEAKAL